MRVKFASALVLGILSLTVFVAIKFAALSESDQSRYLLESVQSEAGLLRANTQILVQHLSDQLVQAVAIEESLRSNITPGVVNTPFIKSDFLMMALLNADPQNGWSVRWSKIKSGVQSGWSGLNEAKMLKELPLASVSQGQVNWHRHLSESGHPVYTFMVEVKDPNSSQTMVALGVLNNQAFSQVIESFKATTREVMVLDDKGNALGYSQQQYVGAPLTAHPMVEKLLQDRKMGEVGEFKDRSGTSVIGAYQRIDGSNMFVMVAQQIGSFSGVISAQLLSLMGLSVAALLFAFVIGFLLIRPTLAVHEYLQDLVVGLAQGYPVSLPPAYAEVEPTLGQAIQKLQMQGAPVHSQQAPSPQPAPSPKSAIEKPMFADQKEQIYKQVASGLATSLRDPVHVILGQAQLARAKAEGHPAEDHFIAIEREARKVRDMVSQLAKVSGAETVHLERAELHEVVLAAIKEIKKQAESLGVQVHKDLRPIGQVMLDVKKMKTALVEILQNSIEAMVDSEKKDLFVVAKEDGKFLSLVIQDTGEGIPGENLAKVFNPFFTTKTDLGQKGLGLSVAKGVVEGCSGKIRVDSTGNEGTRIVIELPLIVAHEDQTALEVPEGRPSSALDKLPVIQQESLVGLKPLSGTAADQLPSIPSIDEEVELSLLRINKDVAHDQDLDLLAGDEDEEIAVHASAGKISIESDSQPVKFSNVVIRKPKVGSDE